MSKVEIIMIAGGIAFICLAVFILTFHCTRANIYKKIAIHMEDIGFTEKDVVSFIRRVDAVKPFRKSKIILKQYK